MPPLRHPEPIEAEPPLAESSPDLPAAPAITEPSIVRERPRRTWRPPPPQPEPPEAPGAGQRLQTPASIWLAWAGTIVVIAILIWGGYTFRTDVMHAWPASQRLYAVIGIGPAPAASPQ